MILVPTVMTAVKIAGIQKVFVDRSFNVPLGIIVPQQPNNKPNCSNQTICQEQPLKVTKCQHDEAHKIGKFLPEFPHNAPHWDLSHRMAEPTKATRSPQWRHPHPNRKKAEYQ